MHIHFFHDAGTEPFHGTDTDEYAFSDLLVGLSFADEFDDQPYHINTVTITYFYALFVFIPDICIPPCTKIFFRHGLCRVCTIIAVSKTGS